MVSEGFRLRAWLPRPAIAPGEDAQLWLTLENMSNKALWFQRTVPEADFPLVVQDARGRTLLPSREAFTVSCLDIELAPGECLVRNYRLKRIYDLPTGGRYSITATARVRRLDGKGWTDVVADTVALTVTEVPAQPSLADKDLRAILFGEERLGVAQVSALMDRRSAPLGGFRLTSELLRTRIFPREPVVLKVTLLNLTSETLSCWETSRESDTDVSFIVEGPQGAVLPKYGLRGGAVDGRVINVPAHGELMLPVQVSRLYDFLAPGEYRITAVCGECRLRGVGRTLSPTPWC
jgi:hypothetical protein